jgi:uncharacterized protein (DUF2336 family)
MDFSVFEQSPAMAPLLVRLYDSHKLYGLASDGTPLARAELTGAVAELLEQDLGPRERELISDVLISLMRQAEADLREALAERLAIVDTAPLRVILHIANDEIEVARPVLNLSQVLSDLDLLYIIKGKTPEYWREIAQRPRLSESVMNMLAETRESQTIRALVENERIQLTYKAAAIIGSMAESDDDLAKPLLLRNDVPEDIARHLYKFIGDELREQLGRRFGPQDYAVTKAIEEVLNEFSGGHKTRNFMPTQAMLDAAQVMALSGRLNAPSMIQQLQRGQFGSFIAMFSQFCGIAPEGIHEMLYDPSGKMLAITCRALDLSKGELSRIYMMTQRIRSEDRIVDHNELLRAIAVYDTVSVDKARAMTNIQVR